MCRRMRISLAFLLIASTSVISSAKARLGDTCYTPAKGCTSSLAHPSNEANRTSSIDASGSATLRLVNGSKSTRHTFQRYYFDSQKNRVTIPSHYESLTFVDFLALPSFHGEYEQSDWTTVRAYNQRGVSLEGYIAEVPPSTGGTIHLHLRDARQPRCFPGGPRQTQLVANVTPAFQPPKTGWSHDALFDLCRNQTRVRLSGWLLHDYQGVRDVEDGRGSAWEIHPVTKIEVWDLTGKRWVELQ